jgi:hypothetical protein
MQRSKIQVISPGFQFIPSGALCYTSDINDGDNAIRQDALRLDHLPLHRHSMDTPIGQQQVIGGAAIQLGLDGHTSA